MQENQRKLTASKLSHSDTSILLKRRLKINHIWHIGTYNHPLIKEYTSLGFGTQ